MGRAPELAAAVQWAWFNGDAEVSVATCGKSADDAAAQPDGFRRLRLRLENPWTGAYADPSSGCGGARRQGQGYRERSQRSRRLPRWRDAERRVIQLATGAWYDPEDAEADNPPEGSEESDAGKRIML